MAENLPEGQIDIQEQQPVSQPQPPQIPQKNWWKVGFLVTLALFLVTGGVLGFYVSKARKVEEAPQPTSVPTLTPIPTPTPRLPVVSPTPTLDPTVNWKTYKNERYKFTLQYPNDYTLEKEEVSDNLALFLKFWFDKNRAPFHLAVLLNKNMLGLKEFYEELEKDNLSGDPISPFVQAEPTIKKLQSGETVCYFKGVYCVVTCDKAVWIKKDKIYEFVNSYYNIPQQDFIFNLMLSTFKFLE